MVRFLIDVEQGGLLPKPPVIRSLVSYKMTTFMVMFVSAAARNRDVNNSEIKQTIFTHRPTHIDLCLRSPNGSKENVTIGLFKQHLLLKRVNPQKVACF